MHLAKVSPLPRLNSVVWRTFPQCRSLVLCLRSGYLIRRRADGKSSNMGTNDIALDKAEFLSVLLEALLYGKTR